MPEKSLAAVKVPAPQSPSPSNKRDTPKEETDTDLLGHLKAAKTGTRNFVVALGKVPGLVLAKSASAERSATKPSYSPADPAN